MMHRHRGHATAAPGYDVDATLPTVPQVLDGVKPANTPAVRNDTTPAARWLYSGGGDTIA